MTGKLVQTIYFSFVFLPFFNKKNKMLLNETQALLNCSEPFRVNLLLLGHIHDFIKINRLL